MKSAVRREGCSMWPGLTQQSPALGTIGLCSMVIMITIYRRVGLAIAGSQSITKIPDHNHLLRQTVRLQYDAASRLNRQCHASCHHLQSFAAGECVWSGGRWKLGDVTSTTVSREVTCTALVGSCSCNTEQRHQLSDYTHGCC